MDRRDRTFRIHYAANPNYVVNLHCNAHKNGTEINLWEVVQVEFDSTADLISCLLVQCNGHESQIWRFVDDQISSAANPGFVINVHCAAQVR